ncbi:MAG: hypothetical protein AAF230_10085 [Pseudomonadota bacterium]
MTPIRSLTSPALVVLFILHSVMLGALYTQTAPHPPLTVAPFAMGPFLGATLALLAATLVAEGQVRRGLALGSVLLSLVSFGPQKYVDAALSEIWPAVVTAQIAIIVLAVGAVRGEAEAATP